MGYYEGEIGPLCGTNNNCNNGSFGNGWEGLIGLALVAGLFDNGNGNGIFGNRGGNNSGCCTAGLATQADLASGFSNSAVLSSLNDIKLGQQQAINYNNQGFAGLSSVINAGFAGVDNAICTLGYQSQAGFNAISTQLAQCCCETKSAIADVKYANERNTCDIINNANANTRAILDYLTGEKIASLQAENSGLKAQISNDRQSAYIVSQLAPKCPQPAYVVQPPQQVTFPIDSCGNFATYNGGCGCNG